MAKQAGLYGVAITDHDTIAGIDEARAEGERIGVIVVPGVEISTIEQGLDIHILGYYIDWTSELFLQRLDHLQRSRDIRNEMIMERLQALGIALTLNEVINEVAADKSADETIGRPHIAQALVKRGIVPTIKAAFDQYLGQTGAAYVNPPRIQPNTAVKWIREAGGKAVLAHPGIYGNNELVKGIVLAGIDGIEVHHSDHTAEQESSYTELAHTHGLIITAGSDFHGIRGNEQIHGPIGNRRIASAVLDRLLAN